MSIIKKIARKALQSLPGEGRFVAESVRRARLQKELMISKIESQGADAALPHPGVTVMLDPARIRLHTAVRNADADWESWVIPQGGPAQASGDWDRSDMLVADKRVCRAVAARVHDRAAWSDTDYHKAALQSVNNGQRFGGCGDSAALERHFELLDQRIAAATQTGLAGAGSGTDFDGVTVNLSRDGWPLFQAGGETLAIARALKLAQVPVRVLLRHAEWQVFRTFLIRMARSDSGAAGAGLLYQSPIHFDLADIPSAHDCDDRWQNMAGHLQPGPGKAMDIGCNLAYFCHGLERLGYTPFGIEYLPDIAYAAQKIARAQEMKFQVVEGDIFAAETQAKIGGGPFKVVIAVNIFHHFLKTEQGHAQLVKFMQNLDCETMFFEPHLTSEAQMQGVFMNPEPDAFAAMMGQWGRFGSVKPIYTAKDGRTVYLLKR